MKLFWIYLAGVAVTWGMTIIMRAIGKIRGDQAQLVQMVGFIWPVTFPLAALLLIGFWLTSFALKVERHVKRKIDDFIIGR